MSNNNTGHIHNSKGWKCDNITCLWTNPNSTSLTPIIDSLMKPVTKPRQKGLTETFGGSS